jgi:hypothetical protein
MSKKLDDRRTALWRHAAARGFPRLRGQVPAGEPAWERFVWSAPPGALRTAEHLLARQRLYHAQQTAGPSGGANGKETGR